MSKNSNWRANKHTVNNLRLKTWLIGMFVFFTGLNFVLMSLYLYLGAGGNELVGAMGFAGILALLGWPAFAFDDRKEMRGTTGVVSKAIIYLISVVFPVCLAISYQLPVYPVLVALGVESGIILGIVLVIRKKP